MYRTLLGILAVFALALLAVGLTFRSTVEEPADFRFVNFTEPKTLDPHLATGEPEGRLISELFEGLTRFDGQTMAPAPGVAKSWELSEDGRRYTFHLRPEARWSDGSALTAQDFVYSFRRLLDPDLGAEYAYIISPVELAVELNGFDGLAALLRQKLRPSVEKLANAHPQGISGKAWQDFLSDQKANEALGHASAPPLGELVQRREGTLTQAELASVPPLLEELAKKLEQGAAEARAHFGVDRGVFAKDAHTLVIELRAPTPYFLEILSFYPTMPVHRATVEHSKHRDAWFLPDSIVSNGPYRLKSWAVNDHVRLERSETYWNRENVKLRRIDALSTESSTTALNLYLTGKVDWLPNAYPKDLADVIKKRPDYYAAPGLTVYYYRLNTLRPPLNDKRVRKALSLAVDREVITRDVLGFGQLPAFTFVPPGLPGYEPPEKGTRLDVARAKALLAEAGYPDGKGFPKLGILYNTLDDHRKIAEVVADQLRKNLGIEVTPYNQEWQSFLETTRHANYDLARAGWVGDYNDPNTFLDLWVTNGGNNQTGFSSPEYDRLIRLAADVSALVEDPDSILPKLSEPERIRPWLSAAKSGSGEERLRAREQIRLALFREAERILVEEELPILPVYFYVNSGLLKPHVKGFRMQVENPGGGLTINTKDQHPLSELSLKDGNP